VDASADLVLLQLANEDGSAFTGSPALTIGDSRTVVAGQKVYTVSAPKGLSQSVSDGLLSAVRSLDGQQYLQITAPVSPGSSGGPVFNAAGEVIGVIKGLIASGENLNFAIPIDAAVRLLNAPMEALERSTELNGTATSKPSQEMFERALAAFNEKQYVLAAQLFERVLTANPTDSAAAYNAGLSYLGSNELAKATGFFARFVELAPADDDGLPFAKKWIAAYAASINEPSDATRQPPQNEPQMSLPSAVAPSSQPPPPHGSSADPSNNNHVVEPYLAASVEGLSAEQVRAVVGRHDSSHRATIEGLSQSDVTRLWGRPSLSKTDPDGVTTLYYDTADGTLMVYVFRDRASLTKPR
jgi:tetratricopeptide (TPR) repeat protein